MISVAGVDFEKRPGVAYKHDYEKILDRARAGIKDPNKPKEKEDPKALELSTLRALILDDLWFVVYFVMGVKIANHPFWVNSAQEIERGPKDFTLDVWAREHGKSTEITKAETIQCALKNPETSSGIFSLKVSATTEEVTVLLSPPFQNATLRLSTIACSSVIQNEYLGAVGSLP